MNLKLNLLQILDEKNVNEVHRQVSISSSSSDSIHIISTGKSGGIGECGEPCNTTDIFGVLI